MLLQIALGSAVLVGLFQFSGGGSHNGVAVQVIGQRHDHEVHLGIGAQLLNRGAGTAAEPRALSFAGLAVPGRRGAA